MVADVLDEGKMASGHQQTADIEPQHLHWGIQIEAVSQMGRGRVRKRACPDGALVHEEAATDQTGVDGGQDVIEEKIWAWQVPGIQNQGVVANVKHLVDNNQEGTSMAPGGRRTSTPSSRR